VTNPYRVTIRLSEEDLEKLKGAAAERGVTVNGLVTDMIRRLR
jgi:predicted DNA binding CopG/RHH family protein